VLLSRTVGVWDGVCCEPGPAVPVGCVLVPAPDGENFSPCHTSVRRPFLESELPLSHGATAVHVSRAVGECAGRQRGHENSEWW